MGILESLMEELQEIKATQRELLRKIDNGGKDEEFWDTNEVAEFLGVKPNTIRNYCSLNRLPFFKIGVKNFFDPKEIKNLIKKNKFKVISQ